MKVIFLLERVTKRIKKFEKDNDQSVLFTLNGDGSGSFEDFWNNGKIKEFEDLLELDEILNDLYR